MRQVRPRDPRAIAGARGVALRSVRAGDEAFLLRVFASTRERELALVPWDDAAKEAFVRMQFTAQDTDYRRNYPDATFDVVLVDGAPAGRLYVDRREREIGIVDVALLPGFRGRGIGTALLGSVLDEGQRSGRAVQIHVERANPAQRLYRRLGFEFAADGEIYVLMRWTAPAAGPAATT